MKFDANDEKILEDWLEDKYISPEIFDESIKSIKDSDDNYISAKTGGNAYARLGHLVAKGVKFRWLCMDPNNKLSQGELIKQYLENDQRVYSLN